MNRLIVLFCAVILLVCLVAIVGFEIAHVNSKLERFQPHPEGNSIVVHSSNLQKAVPAANEIAFLEAEQLSAPSDRDRTEQGTAGPSAPPLEKQIPSLECETTAQCDVCPSSPPLIEEPPCCSVDACLPIPCCSELPSPCPSPCQRDSLDKYPLPKRLTLRHVEGWGEGVGFGTDYTTFAALLAPVYRLDHTLPMIDLRIHRFDNNTYAANFGLATRYIPGPDSMFEEILGFNAFYDYREGMKGNYSQIGLGIEILGCRWDFRANGFAPIGVKKHKTKCVFDEYSGGYYAIHRECEFVSYGYNAEIGYMALQRCNFLFYAAAGPYYLVKTGCGRTAGGKLRVRPQYKDYLALDLSVSHDPVFNTVYQLEFIVYVPLYQISTRRRCRYTCGLTDRQIYQPIERFEVMPFGRSSCWETNF